MIRTVNDILLSAGGVRAVAGECGVSVSAVEKWRRNGIPDLHWPHFVTAEWASPAELYAANVALRRAESEPAHE